MDNRLFNSGSRSKTPPDVCAGGVGGSDGNQNIPTLLVCSIRTHADRANSSLKPLNDKNKLYYYGVRYFIDHHILYKVKWFKTIVYIYYSVNNGSCEF